MSDQQTLETTISQLPEHCQYLVRECAHEVQQVLDRYKDRGITALSLELVTLELRDSIRY